MKLFPPVAAPAALAAFSVLAAGCATTEPGWTGSGAMPFATAEALCKSRAQQVRRPEAREAAFRVCMSEHGWRQEPAGS